MKDQLITLETAILAKEKGFGFDLETIYPHSYNKDEKIVLNASNNTEPGFTAAPRQSELQKWLREIKNLHVSITVNQFGYGYMFSLIDILKCECAQYLKGGPNYKYSYEEALEQGLKDSLNLIIVNP